MTGWIGRRRQQRRVASMADPAAGTLQVTAASYPPTGESVMFSNYQVTGVVSAPGLPPTAVEQRGIARVSQWPQPGAMLPVTVDRAHPAQFVIAWDQVPSAAEQALADARNLALHEQINLDFSVLNDAIDRSSQGPGASGLTAPAPGAGPGQGIPPRLPADPAAAPAADRPPSSQPQESEQPQVPVPGSVVAVYPVPVPAAFTPPGGIWDLSVQTADRTVLVRASFDSEEERATVARVGATVTVALSGSTDVATLVTTDRG